MGGELTAPLWPDTRLRPAGLSARLEAGLPDAAGGRGPSGPRGRHVPAAGAGASGLHLGDAEPRPELRWRPGPEASFVLAGEGRAGRPGRRFPGPGSGVRARARPASRGPGEEGCGFLSAVHCGHRRSLRGFPFSSSDQWGFTGGSAVKNQPVERRRGFDRWVGENPWRRRWLPTPGCSPGIPMDTGA